jgi:spore maturation protein SpmA
MWVAITSSNPHPSETAKVMGPYWMNKATNWFGLGTAFVALCIASVIANQWLKKRDSDASR